MTDASGDECPYQDDTSISDDDFVYRRVGPDFWDGNLSHHRGVGPGLRTNAFQPWPEAKALAEGLPATGMSVGLRSVLDEHDKVPSIMLAKFESSYGLVGVAVVELRAAGLGLVRWPTDEEPWHCVVFHRPNLRKFPKGVQKSLRWETDWIVAPGAWEPPEM